MITEATNQIEPLAPVDVAPVDVAPVDVAPVDVAPVDVAPVDVARVDVAPVDVARVDVAPVDVAPVDVARVDVAPVDLALVDLAPADIAPADIDHEVDTVGARIERRAAAYAELPVFRAVRADRVPTERFPAFFREQAVAARFFQDLIWAATDIYTPELGPFAAAHRKVDSGHWRWSEHDLEATDQRPLTINDCFALEFLETRIQMARMLAVFHDASPTERLVALCALETAGTITLGTLFAYVTRHRLDHVLYLGKPHVHIEENQVEGLRERLGAVLDGNEPRLLAIVDTIFDALTCMFDRGAARHWADLVEAA